MQKIGWWELDVPNSMFSWLADKRNLLFFRQDYFKIINEVLPLIIWEENKINFWRLREISEDLWLWYYLHWIVEEAKIDLTQKSETSSDFNNFNIPFQSKLLRGKFEDLIQDEIERLRLWILGIISDAWINPENIDTLF